MPRPLALCQWADKACTFVHATCCDACVTQLPVRVRVRVPTAVCERRVCVCVSLLRGPGARPVVSVAADCGRFTRATGRSATAAAPALAPRTTVTRRSSRCIAVWHASAA